MEKEDGLASFEVIGRGGCGEVYKAELPRKIIVIKKIIAAKLSKEDSKRMNQNMCQVRSEIQTVGQLRHHNVLPLLAHLSRSDCHYLTYKFMVNSKFRFLPFYYCIQASLK
uniref:non-specific serine/threonine protein kinase n=1 Tax=Davidia involucrata TaxID=16924 RepID=A0A5B7B9B2_DAVIN